MPTFITHWWQVMSLLLAVTRLSPNQTQRIILTSTPTLTALNPAQPHASSFPLLARDHSPPQHIALHWSLTN